MKRDFTCVLMKKGDVSNAQLKHFVWRNFNTLCTGSIYNPKKAQRRFNIDENLMRTIISRSNILMLTSTEKYTQSTKPNKGM